MNPYEQLKVQLPEIQKALNYTFSSQELLLSSLTHRSFINENKELNLQHNERLEFLGDSVLNLVFAEFLYTELPTISEGELSQLRAHLVSSQSCIEFVKMLGIEKSLLVGKGEKMSTSRGKSSMIADLFEAILGALYLDGGFECAKKFLLHHFSSKIREMLKKPQLNYKAILQEFTQKNKRSIPQYHVITETGPDHEKNFEIGVYIEGEMVSSGKGCSKKEAEQDAAQLALIKLNPEEFHHES